MASPDVGGTVPTWVQELGAVLLFFVTLGGQAWQYLRKQAAEEPARHVVLEQAEIADMNAFRLVADRLKDVLELDADVAETKRAVLAMEALLKKMDQEGEVERQVEARLREERVQRDRSSASRRGHD